MLRPRIIPCLLVHDKGLVKTVNFSNPKYVGDPINAVRIFNEKEVDELIVLDIDASVENREPDYQMIKNLAAECRMPFCYGGGVKNVSQAKKIINLGAEKVALSSAAIDNPNLVKAIATAIGNQSVVVVMDIKKLGLLKKYRLFTHNGKKKVSIDFIQFAKLMEANGAGEIVVNSIDKEGTMKGYDFDLIDKVREAISIPITVMGGAGSINDFGKVISRHGIIGVAAGSLFVFKGVYRAVLINYPNLEEKKNLIESSLVTK
jgi:cyclase